MREIPLSQFGLETVREVCDRKGWAPKSVQNWVKAGLLAAVSVGSGRGSYLLVAAEVNAFVLPQRGRPKPKSAPADKPVKKRSSGSQGRGP